jgi:hypothetical protein
MATSDHSSLIKEAMDLLKLDVKEEGHTWRFVLEIFDKANSLETNNGQVEVKSTKRKKVVSFNLESISKGRDVHPGIQSKRNPTSYSQKPFGENYLGYRKCQGNYDIQKNPNSI